MSPLKSTVHVLCLSTAEQPWLNLVSLGPEFSKTSITYTSDSLGSFGIVLALHAFLTKDYNFHASAGISHSLVSHFIHQQINNFFHKTYFAHPQRSGFQAHSILGTRSSV